MRNKGIRIWNELTEDDIRLQSTNWEGTSSVSNTNRVMAWEHHGRKKDLGKTGIYAFKRTHILMTSTCEIRRTLKVCCYHELLPC